MTTFADIIDRFPSAEVLASALGEKGGTVRAWRARNSIPSRYWLALVAAAQALGIDGVTHEVLLVTAAGNPAVAQQARPEAAA